MTASQRVIEIISLLKVKGFPHMAEILEVLHADDDEGQEVIGLSMRRYQRTLKQYTHSHSHHRLTAHQKLDIIRQMLHCIESIHDVGIAHRDLSEVNFMVDELDNDPRLPDGSTAAHVYLIDFGKAIFTTPEDARRWWIAPVPKQYQQQLLLKAQGSISTSTSSSTTTTAASSPTPISPSGGSPSADLTTMTLPGHEYDGEVIPETKEDLDTWCERLPLVYLKPDHGYRHYRSIQTLPRNRTDHAILPWLVDPMAEDMYSMGTLMWKIFAETEPWHGILDTDLRQLRETVEEDEKIEIRVKREIAGDLSQQLVLFCLKTQPEERATATDLLAWLDQPNITKGLLEEWTVHAPTERKKRHAKSAFEFEEEQARHSLASARNRKAAKKKKQLQQQQYEQEQRKAERERVKLEKEKQKQQEKLQLQPSMIYPQPPPPPPVYYYPPFPFYSMQNTSSMSSPLQQQQQQPSISSAPFNSYQPAPPPPQHSAFRNLRFTMPMTPNGPATTSNKPTSPMIVDSHPDTTSFLPPDKWIQDPSMYPLSNVRTEMQGPAESQSPPRRVFYQQKLRWMYNSTSKLGFTTGKETTADSTTVSTIKTTTNQSSISMESISKQQQEETTTSSGSSSSSSKSGYVKTGKPLGRPKGSISKRKRRQQQYHRHRQEKSNQTSIVEMSSPTEQQS
ncbi:kinase-like domain-containing protein [Halteromyces radiatus]|uniref:kinase-like domain-containing protein n=1 Tax=Halteromyces radiatus TaxID=101107 RepID=UPI00221E5A80|nr:kinase-like domain-containing protein [Halteromyces radiatus]KAI8080083.1 kinase-like domain-containing protein [Halteromyces radiatus]